MYIVLFYSCRSDYIDVYIQLTSPDDPLLDAELLGRFCGDDMQEDLPQQVISTNNVVIIIFFSDHEKTYDGFHGHFEFIDAGEYIRFYIISFDDITKEIRIINFGKGILL